MPGSGHAVPGASAGCQRGTREFGDPGGRPAARLTVMRGPPRRTTMPPRVPLAAAHRGGGSGCGTDCTGGGGPPRIHPGSARSPMAARPIAPRRGRARPPGGPGGQDVLPAAPHKRQPAGERRQASEAAAEQRSLPEWSKPPGCGHDRAAQAGQPGRRRRLASREGTASRHRHSGQPRGNRTSEGPDAPKARAAQRDPRCRSELASRGCSIAAPHAAVRCAIRQRRVLPDAANPRPERRSNDGQAIFRT